MAHWRHVFERGYDFIEIHPDVHQTEEKFTIVHQRHVQYPGLPSELGFERSGAVHKPIN